VAESVARGSAPEALNALLDELERRRWSVLKSYWKAVAWLVLGTLIVAGTFGVLIWMLDKGIAQDNMRPHEDAIALTLFALPPVWLFVAGWAFRRFANRPKWQYLNRFKNEVFTEVCSHHFPTLKYEPAAGIAYRQFDGSHLFPYEADVYSSEDRFSGVLEHTTVTFAEVRAKRKRRRLTSEGMATEYQEYFRGLMLVADFHKHFHSAIRILPASDDFVSLPGEERVVTEDPDFERSFVVLGTDQIDARYVLSSSMLSRIFQLARRFGHIRLGFSSDHMTLLLPRSRDQFEPSLYRKATSRKQIARFVDDISSVLALVTELDLNTRIWSKRPAGRSA
jgi:hypothetical protein